MQNIVDENPDTVKINLPKVINYLIENGKPPNNSKSRFWYNDNYTLGVSMFAKSLPMYDSPKLPVIFFESVI